MKALCINLEHRQDRWGAMVKRFEEQGLEVERVEAVTHTEKWISFNLSQIKALSMVSRETVIFEDDVIFTRPFLKDIEPPEGWDGVYFGGNVREDLVRIGDWWRVKNTWTTHAILYTEKAAKQILKEFDPYSMIYDEWLRTIGQEIMNFYIQKPYACIQEAGFSDLAGGVTFYDLQMTEIRLI